MGKSKSLIKEIGLLLSIGKSRVFGYIVEADIKGYFDNICHEKLVAMLEKRINDRAFIRLITKWLKAGILEPDGYVKHPVTGTPQGGIVSPILSNLYLHIVLERTCDHVQICR
jgi:RNA-directed DNA polymerase